MARTGKTQKHYRLTLAFPMGITRAVDVWASSLAIAERRALKRNPSALYVKKPEA